MTNDLLGRLHIWNEALRQSVRCVRLAQLLDKVAGGEFVRTENDRQLANFRARTGRAYDPAVSEPGDGDIMEQARAGLLLDVHCNQAAVFLRDMAVVHFSTLYTSGGGAPDVAAKNTDKRAAALLCRVVKEAFPKPSDYTGFSQLKDEAVQLRNHRISHASAHSYSIQHGTDTVQMRYVTVAPDWADSLARAGEALQAAMLFVLMTEAVCKDRRPPSGNKGCI